MKIFINFKLTNSPTGGTNAFLTVLCQEIQRRGVEFVEDYTKADLLLLNALHSDNIEHGDKILNIDKIKEIYKEGIPIVHRKTGYWGRGSQIMRRINDEGIVYGDTLQLKLSPYIKHHIFQSEYSYQVFRESGFTGDNYSIIHNGVDTRIFNLWCPNKSLKHRVKLCLNDQIQTQAVRLKFFSLVYRGYRKCFSNTIEPSGRVRTFWKKGQSFKLIISSWSNDLNKGFSFYQELDNILPSLNNVEVCFVGRIPPKTRFRNIMVYPPMMKSDLADLLKQHHAFIQLSQNDTCSNALIEGISCGLPIIYLNSGSNKELADGYGVEYTGNWKIDIEKIMADYNEVVLRLRLVPFSIERVADKYFSVIQNVLSS